MEKYYKENKKYYCDGVKMAPSTWYRDRRIYLEKLKNSTKTVEKEKPERKKSTKSTLEHEKEIIKFKWLLDKRSDKYLLLDKIEEYKTGRRNSTYRLTKQCLKYLNKEIEDRQNIRILINKELK